MWLALAKPNNNNVKADMHVWQQALLCACPQRRSPYLIIIISRLILLPESELCGTVPD